MNIVTNMEALARKWHDEQFRKGPEHLPYIVHPEAVVDQLKSWGYSAEHDPIVLAVGWGHDLFEDTTIPAIEVLKACGLSGPEVISGIAWLTFCRDNWPEAESKDKAKALYIEHVARFAPPDILAVKLADRLCNLRDFAKLHGKRSEKVRSYYWEAETLFNNIRRLPEKLQQIVRQTESDVIYDMVFPNPYELRDEWTDSFYIVKDPPIAFGFIFEGKFAYDGCDFCMAFPEHEDWSGIQRKIKKVPQFIAEAYGDGDICPEEINWDDNAPVQCLKTDRRCTGDKKCFGTPGCRAMSTKRRSSEEIAALVQSLARKAEP